MSTPLAHGPHAQSPVIFRRYGRLGAVGTEAETHLSWRGDVAYARAMPLGPWLLALPACLFIAVALTMAMGGPRSIGSVTKGLLGYAVACGLSWIAAFFAVRAGLWLYGQLVRTSLILTPHGIACQREGPLGAVPLVPAGSRLNGAQRGEHAERTRGLTVTRQPFVHLRATDPTGRQHHAEIGHGLDEEGLSALLWMLGERL